MESLITKATVTEWSFGIIGILGAVGGLCGIIGKILTTSRCSDCSFCFGLCKVKNDPLEADEISALTETNEVAPPDQVKPPEKQEIVLEESEP
tara:strand:- start:177 stop:455 length:279 start_codon:yes stop_codon:yes gene_type:complete